MVGVRYDNPLIVPPIETIMISAIQGRMRGFTEEFLRQKYSSECLSIAEIAAQTFSARATVLHHLKRFGIATRRAGSTIHRKNGRGVPYGMRLEKRLLIRHQREQEAIARMQQLRSQGFTLAAIAEAFNTLGVPTKTVRARWSAKTVQQVLRAQPPANTVLAPPIDQPPPPR